MLSHKPLSGIVGAKNLLKVKLYPNGECAVYKAKSYAPQPISMYQPTEETIEKMRLFRMMCLQPELFQYAPLLLGLSPHPNSDKWFTEPDSDTSTGLVTRSAYGQNGITSYGARRVRNAAYLLQKEFGKFRCVFATVTVPNLPVEQMEVLHKRFSHLVELYRLGLKRLLQDKGLSGELVGVAEVQEKRYERTGVPVLHLHTVFVNRARDGQWVVTPKTHDDVWLAAINATLGQKLPDVQSACNLSAVRDNAEGYLGKYMTKGVTIVKRIISQGLGGWLPKQWWSCSRSLSERVDAATTQVDEFAEFLLESIEADGSGCWLWHRAIQMVKDNGDKLTIAYYGKLEPVVAQGIQEYYPIDSG